MPAAMTLRRPNLASNCAVRSSVTTVVSILAPAILKWLGAHPRFHMHFTPTYSSWLNHVERFFAYVTADLLQRSDHRSVQALEKDIRNWFKNWDENPKPFIWTKTNRSSTHSNDYYNGLPAQDTSCCSSRPSLDILEKAWERYRTLIVVTFPRPAVGKISR